MDKCTICKGPFDTRTGMWLHPVDDDGHPGFPMCGECVHDYNRRHPDKPLRCECCGDKAP